MNNELHKGARKELFEFAKQNRKASTNAEEILWHYLRGKKLAGFKFRRQHPFADFIVDFYCHEKMIAIEVDGSYHEIPEQKDYDLGRTYELEELGVKVVWFKNEKITDNIIEVLEIIKSHLS